MISSNFSYEHGPEPRPSVVREQDIESSFLEKLRDLKYTDRPDIRDRAALEANFREKFEALNRVHLTNAEFARLLDEIVTPDVFTASKTLRAITSFTRDDGTPLNYSLVNLKDWCKNHFEVVSQLRINTDNSHHRYDVLLLINGVPAVQIELKTLGISPRRAMEQIVEYKHDPGNGYTKTLLCFLQLFIVSNRDRTYYFANNNARHFAFNAEERFLPIYEFADEANKKITHLDDFAGSFLKKCDLGRTISRTMVLIESEQKLMIMRPYQVYAVQHIVKCIEEDNGNGFIWHTTGSGKTLTSFKASTLLKLNDHVHKCVFVVDRKDLDRQTREEFNRFQENCVEENTNTAALVRRLLSEDYADKVIVTTIQKLGLALDETSKRNTQRKKHDQPTYKEMLAPLSDQRIVFIFDECQSSQFGENHQAIKEFFPRAQLFGFTGTPIFEANASLQKIEDTQASMRTTEDLFQKRLHAYTITHAIEDGNVLRFHIDYFKPKEEAGKNPPKPGEAIAKRAVIDAILSKHDAATGGRRFNAVLATASINDAIEYFALFAEMQQQKAAADPEFTPLNIACVFSPTGGARRERRGQKGHRAALRRPAAGAGRQPGRSRGEEEGTRGHRRGLQCPLRHEPPPQRLRSLLPGCAEAHQRPAVARRGFAEGLPERPAPQDRHHHRRGHAAHRFRFQVPEHALRRQESPAPRPHPGLLPHQSRAQWHQALRQHPRLPPAAARRGCRHRPL